MTLINRNKIAFTICGLLLLFSEMVMSAMAVTPDSEEGNCPIARYEIHIFADDKGNAARCFQVKTNSEWSFVYGRTKRAVNMTNPAFCTYQFDGKQYRDDTFPDEILHEQELNDKTDDDDSIVTSIEKQLQQKSLQAILFLSHGTRQTCQDKNAIDRLSEYWAENPSVISDIGVADNTDWNRLVSTKSMFGQVVLLLNNLSVSQWQSFIGHLASKKPNVNLPFFVHAFEASAPLSFCEKLPCHLELPRGYKRTKAKQPQGRFALLVHGWLQYGETALGQHLSHKPSPQELSTTLTIERDINQKKVAEMAQTIADLEKQLAAQASLPTVRTAAPPNMSLEIQRSLQVIEKIASLVKDESIAIQSLSVRVDNLNHTMTEGYLGRAIISLLILVALQLLSFIGFNLYKSRQHQ